MFDLAQNGIITVTRGDSFTVPLFINCGSDMTPKRYKLNDKDKIYLAITEPNQQFEDAIVKKVFTKNDFNRNEDVEITIEHDDTRCLIPGKYFYQIKGEIYNPNKEKHEVVTIISKTQFIIEE